MNILAFFTNNGIPAINLTIPTIKIREVPSGSIVINNSNMVEVGDGFYSYDFTSYDKNKDYSIICDGTSSLNDSDRYVYAGNENYIEDIENSSLSTKILSVSASVLENQDYLKRIVGLVHENIFIDNPTFDSDGNMTSARLRIYSSPTDVGTSTNVIGTYNISAPGDGPGKFTNWSQIRVS